MALNIMIPPEVNIEEFVMDYIHDNGYPNLNAHGKMLTTEEVLAKGGCYSTWEDAILVRMFSSSRLKKMIKLGTDRDSSSIIHSLKGNFPKRNYSPEEIIYVSFIGGMTELPIETSLAVYDPHKLESTCNYGGGMIYTAKPPFTFKDALISVFSQEKITLT